MSELPPRPQPDQVGATLSSREKEISGSRRDFFRKFAQIAAGAGFLAYGVRVLARDSSAAPEGTEASGDDYDWNEHFWAMLINVKKCIGCYTCMRGCSTENDIGDRGMRTWVERYTIDQENAVTVDVVEQAYSQNSESFLGAPHYLPVREGTEVREQFFVPKLCNHCAVPPCTQVCPVGSTYQTKDGVVVIDHDSCIGCGYCIQSCPYGARFWDTKFLCANKCDFCYHRITKGLQPACVLACPTGTRVFGDLKDPDSPVYQALHSEKGTMLKRHLGTEPKVYYTDLHKEIV
jgi:tetrathionate reductase subunit B